MSIPESAVAIVGQMRIVEEKLQHYYDTSRPTNRGVPSIQPTAVKHRRKVLAEAVEQIAILHRLVSAQRDLEQ